MKFLKLFQKKEENVRRRNPLSITPDKSVVWHHAPKINRTKNRDKKDYSDILKKIIRKIGGNKRLIIGIPIIIIIFILINYVFKIEWTVSSINYIGNENLSSMSLDQTLYEFFGENIFKIRIGEVEKKLDESYVEIKSVRVEKKMPNTLDVYIEEKIPKFVLINLNGIYVIDSKGEVLVAYQNDDKVELEENELDIARGFGGVNASYIEDRYLTDNEDQIENIEDFSFDDVSPEKREEILNIITQEKKSKFNQYLEYDTSLIGEYSHLNKIKAWDETMYEVGEFLSEDLIVFLTKPVEVIGESEDIKIEKVLWDGDLRLELTLDSGTVLIFARNIEGDRSINNQIEDFFAFNEYDQRSLSAIKSIDLSSKKIVVEKY